jgi:hypothetical protein
MLDPNIEYFPDAADPAVAPFTRVFVKLMFAHASLDERIRDLLGIITGDKMLNEETEAGQRYRSWTTSVNGYSVLIMLTTLQNERVAEGTLAAAVKQASAR